MSSTEDFFTYLIHQKKYSLNTVQSYQRDITAFQEYLNSHYDGISIEKANEQIIRSWFVLMMEKGMKASTIKRKKAAVTTLFKYLIRQGIVRTIPTRTVRTPKTEQKLPVFIPEKKLQKLFEEDFYSIQNYEDLCNRMILETFYATGIRVSELVTLTNQSFDLSNGHIKVFGKRSKERLIPIHADFLNMIQYFMQVKENHFSTANVEDRFFLTQTGKKIYRKFVYRVIFSYLSTVTSQNKKSPHVIRHTFATHLLNEGADINAIKEILGHSSLAATQIYTHNTIEQLKNVYKKTHPKSQTRRK